MRKTLALLFLGVLVWGQTAYQKPPKEILDVLGAPQAPLASLSPTRAHMALVEMVRYPSIADVARPMLRLAGLRIDPASNGAHMTTYAVGLTIKQVSGGAEIKVQVPPNPRMGQPQWSADGRFLAFINATPSATELWIVETATGKARRVEGAAVNAAQGDPIEWMPDNRTLLVKLVPAGRGKPPAAPPTPVGPVIQESLGKAAPAPTFQDMLSSPRDEDRFDYYTTAQLAWIDVASGKITPYGQPGVFQTIQAAPDGKHVLVARVHRPYSYLHPVFAFPKDVEVWDRGAKLVHKLASLPLADRVPIEGVPTGPRAYAWRPTEPATLVWIEALDGGNPKEKVPHRDRVLLLKAPFTGAPVEVTKTEHRLMGGGRFSGGGPMQWGEKGLLLVSDYERNRRWSRTFLVNADDPVRAPRMIFSRNVQDRYKDPGTTVMETLPSGHRAIRQRGNFIFLSGDGATPEGDRPFLDRLDLTTLKTERLFRSDSSSHETVVGLLDENGSRIMTRRESPTDPPNYFVRAGSTLTALTRFPDPAPALRGITKRLVTYQRSDGVPLSFTLYLPPGYREGTRLPTVVWAYPLEFNDADTAGQIAGSTQRFTTIAGMSHLFFLLRGYAVLDGATMPVVGNPETVNNTYIEQIVMSAKAAIDKAVELGVTDRERVGVGGHSYGAFMTANLLAHSDLFRAGIARSGAYNRTLTPFGFQSERRTLWEARDTYLRMSPFLNAERIKEPLLLIHGEADNNTGTFPIQSERMYQAVRGNGGTVRFVLLPHESHGYSARESIEHTLSEMISWFDQHVKNAPRLTSAR